MKYKYIEAGRFEKKVKFYLESRRIVHSAMFLIYVVFLVGWSCIIIFSTPAYSESKLIIVYKVHDLSILARILVFLGFCSVLAGHVLGYWLAEKLNEAKDLMIIEQEDVIVQMSEETEEDAVHQEADKTLNSNDE